MKRTLLVAGAMAGALISASTASATLVTVTLTGASENVNDATGVFGAPGRITSLPFVETFTIDTTGASFPSSANAVSFNSIFGSGPPYAVSGSLTIGGSPAFTTLGADYSSVFASAGGDYQILSNDQPTPTGGGSSNLNFYLDLTGPGLPTTVTQPFTMALTPSQVGADSFIDGVTDASGAPIVDAQGMLNPTLITIAEVSAAPEPSTWALMFAGVGLAGAALRRRGRALAA